MDKESSKNIKRGLIFLILSFLMFIPALIVGHFNMAEPYAWSTLSSYRVVIDTKQEKDVIIKSEPTKTSKLPNEAQKKPKKRKEWVCKPPRDLWQGSGWVKECEWN